MATPHMPTPRWHPIASLSLIARVIDGQLEAAEEQHRLLLQARPGSLDDTIVERVVRVYTEEVDFFAIYHEQFDRWCSGPLTVVQRQEVERLRGRLARNRDVDAAILTLAETLKAITTEAILAKSDLELGLDALTGQSPLFPRERPRDRNRSK